MNKDLKTKEYLEKLGSLKLSESSRSRIENNLLEYAKFHGVRVEEDGRFIEQVPQRTSLFSLFKQPKSMTAAIIALALIAGGGTSYAAEGAVPGDFLCTMKTEINENIKSAFALGNEAEASLQARLAEERLKEAEALAAEGQLTAEASADISSRLKAHYDEAEEYNSAVEADGDFESSAAVRASLEGSFRTYAEILTDLNTRVSGNSGASLISDILTYAGVTADAQTQATATIKTSADLKSIAEAMVERSEAAIAEVENELTEVKTKISAEAHVRAEAKLKEAIAAQAEAEASLRTETYQTAYSSAQTALRLTGEVKTMLDSSLRLKIDTGLDAGSALDVNLNIGTGSEDQTESDQIETESNTKPTDESRDSSTGVEVDVTGDASVDTEVINIETETNTSVRSGLNL